MRIRVKSTRRNIDRVTVNLASMIDLTFLLLIYFMVTTVFALQEDRLRPSLQTQRDDATGLTSDFQPQRVEVTLDGTRPIYRLAGRILDAQAALRAALEPLPKEPGVFIEVKDRVPVGFAVGAVQAARDAGFEQVTYVPSK